jgi:hypothetical protein
MIATPHQRNRPVKQHVKLHRNLMDSSSITLTDDTSIHILDSLAVGFRVPANAWELITWNGIKPTYRCLLSL